MDSDSRELSSSSDCSESFHGERVIPLLSYVFPCLYRFFPFLDGIYPVNDNTSIQGSKSDKSPVTFLEYVLSYKERTVFISLINHSKQKQITYTIKEVVPISSKRVLELYGEVSKDKKHETLYDTDSYSLFKKKGYIDYTLYHITGDQGIVSYTYAGIINY